MSTDGKRILTSSEDGTARLWDPATGRLVSTLKGHSGSVTTASFSSDGSKVLTASDDWTAHLWGAETAVTLGRFTGHTGPINDARFLPGEAQVVTVSGDGTARLWSTADSKPGTVFIGHTGAVRSVDITSDGSTLLTSGDDGSIRLWDRRSGRLLSRFDSSGPVATARFASADTRILSITNAGELELREAKTGLRLPLATVKGPVTAFAIGPAKLNFATASADGVWAWDATTGVVVKHLLTDGHKVSAMAFSVEFENKIAAGDVSGDLMIWDRTDGHLVAAVHDHLDAISAVAFAPDGSRVITGSRDFSANVYPSSIAGFLQSACEMLRHQDSYERARETCDAPLAAESAKSPTPP